MAKIKGTNVAAPVVPFDTADTYPTHDEKYGKGGWRSVVNATARDAIPPTLRTAGMVVYVQDDEVAYQLTSDLTSWNPFTTGGGGGRYDIGVFCSGKADDGQVILILPIVTSFTFPANLVDSKFKLGVNGTATTTFTLKKNSSNIGTVAFATSGTPTVAFSSDITFNAGDVFYIVNQSPADATASDPSFTFVAQLST